MNKRYPLRFTGYEIEELMDQIFLNEGDNLKFCLPENLGKYLGQYYISNDLAKELMYQCAKKKVKGETEKHIRLEWKGQQKIILEISGVSYSRVYDCSCYKIEVVKRQGKSGKERINFVKNYTEHQLNKDIMLFDLQTEEEYEN